MFFKNVIAIVCLVGMWPVAVLAHGEDRYGPHGGFIRMPGAFHTEIKMESVTRLRVYLLDVSKKNSKIENSTLKLTLKRNSLEWSCVAVKDYFVCRAPKGTKLEKGDEVQLLASRDGQVGGLVSYSFPFKLQILGGHHEK